MRITAIILPAALLLIYPLTVDATTWYIKADGTGDAPSIQAGIDAAAVNDTVLVAAGTYTGIGNRPIYLKGKDLTLRSESGRDVTIIDCEGSANCMMFYSGEGPACVVEGLEIRNGYTGPAQVGGAVVCVSTSPTITDCKFTDCTAGNGGGMWCEDGASPKITDCIFSGNSGNNGGAAWCINNCDPTFIDCTFSGNEAIVADGGGMVFTESCSPTLIGCTFADNSAIYSDGGGVVCTTGSTPAFTNCTFSGNSAGNNGGGIACRGASATLENCIIAFSIQGEGVYCDATGSAILTCCDVFGNAGGDWVGCIAGQNGVDGNISADPLFCGEATDPKDPYGLDVDSPCTAGNSPCEQIGARPPRCSGPFATEPATWGRVKATYR